MLEIFGSMFALVLSVAFVVLNSFGMNLISEWVFFQYIGIHFTTVFFVGIIAILLMLGRKSKKPELKLADAMAEVISHTIIFWLLVLAIYLIK